MFYKIKSKLIGWFGNIQVFKHPFFMLFGHTAYKIKGQDQREILDLIQPGDVLLRRYDHYLSGLMIPGYFTHAAMYVGDNQIIHLLGKGICKEDILTFMRCDNIMLLRFKNTEAVPSAIKAANEQLAKGIKYDYDFDMDKPDKFYCTEFVDFCYGYPIRPTLDHNQILPDDFMGALTFSIVWTKGGK